MKIAVNSVLFVCALLLLLDFAPSDAHRATRENSTAISMLIEKKNIVRHVPGVKIEFQNQGHFDESTFLVLEKMISKNASLGDEFPWSRVVGVGYASVRMPVGNGSVDAFRSLYIAVTPEGEGSVLELIPIGPIEELSNWMRIDRSRSAMAAATMLLMVNFVVQITTDLRARADLNRSNA